MLACFRAGGKFPNWRGFGGRANAWRGDGGKSCPICIWRVGDKKTGFPDYLLISNGSYMQVILGLDPRISCFKRLDSRSDHPTRSLAIVRGPRTPGMTMVGVGCSGKRLDSRSIHPTQSQAIARGPRSPGMTRGRGRVFLWQGILGSTTPEPEDDVLSSTGVLYFFLCHFVSLFFKRKDWIPADPPHPIASDCARTPAPE